MMVHSSLGALPWNEPELVVPLDLVPPPTDQLVGSQAGQDQQLKCLRTDRVSAFPHITKEMRHLGVRQGRVRRNHPRLAFREFVPLHQRTPVGRVCGGPPILCYRKLKYGRHPLQDLVRGVRGLRPDRRNDFNNVINRYVLAGLYGTGQPGRD